MSNPTSVIVLTDSLAQFLARTNQFGEANQDLIQQKFNKAQDDGSTSPVFAALESRSRAVAQWANMVDDLILAVFQTGGGLTGIAFDNRGSPVVTPQAVSGGGTADFTIDVGRDFGVGIYLRAVSNASSVGGIIQLFRDVARTDFVYQGTFVGVDHIERTPFTAMGDDGSNLESTTLYGRMTNSGGIDSTYNVELVMQG